MRKNKSPVKGNQKGAYVPSFKTKLKIDLVEYKILTDEMVIRSQQEFIPKEVNILN